MFYRFLILMMVLGLTGPAVLAQRVFKTIDPNAGLETPAYKFDTNNIPVGYENPGSPQLNDINIPPNIVFAPDSSKGFVTYPGSDKLLVFRPSDGEILATLDVPKNPVNLAMTPDGKKIAVPCLYLKDNAPDKDNLLGKQIGAIAIIDVETHAQTRLELTKVQFSFANNVVFSADGKTGYVASSGTDEILRFNPETATEITPRLSMKPSPDKGGTRPSSLTMAPDSSFLTAVLVGSTFLDRRQTPDTVAIIDTAGFSWVRSVKTQVKATELPFDFLPVNTVALTSDGKLGLIADQAMGRATQSILAEDRAILFETATGEIKKIFNTGNLPGSAHTTPDGTRFVLIGEIWVMLIDSVSEGMSTASPIYADFKPGNRPAFSVDGKHMYISTPLSDHLLVFSLEEGQVVRYLDVGRLVQPPVGEDDPKRGLWAAPLELAVTPDGEVIAAVNFNYDTIDLIRDTFYFGIPLFFHTDTWFTGVALTNLGEREATIELAAYSRAGVGYQDETSTADVVEYTNPNTIKLPPGQQTAFTASELLKPSGDKTIDGWLDVDSDVFETTSFFLVGDAALKRLDGAPVFLQSARTVVIPEVRVTDGFKTELTLFNYTWSESYAVMELFNQEGTSLFQSDLIRLYGGMQTVGFVRDPDGEGDLAGIFPETAFENFTEGYIVVSATVPLTAIERYYDEERMSVVQGIPQLPGFDDQTRFLVPQVAMFGDAETYVNLINAWAETASVTLILRDSAGNPVGTAGTVQIEAGKQVRKKLSEILEMSDPGQIVSGWLQLDADRPGVVGDVEIRAYGDKAMTTLPLISNAGKELVFSHVAEGLGYATGLALVNPGQVDATAQVEVFAKDGTGVAGRNVTVPAGGRLLNLLSDDALFPELNDIVGGYVRVSSDQDLVGVQMFFTYNLEILSLVPAQMIN
jgi:DNA-binding beta-propeller fold protein YncE